MSCHQNSSNVNRLQLKLVVCSSQYNSNKKEEENKQQIYVSADMCVSPCLWQALSLSHTHTSLCKTRIYRWCNLSEPDVVVNFIADSYEGIQYPWKRLGPCSWSAMKLTTTSGSLRLCCWYSWSLANRLFRLHTLMCKDMWRGDRYAAAPLTLLHWMMFPVMI